MKVQHEPKTLYQDQRDRTRLLQERGGQAFLLGHHLDLQEVQPGVAFEVQTQPSVRFTPLAVAHGGIKGAVVFVAEACGKKAVFAWDMDAHDKRVPSGAGTNSDTITEQAGLLSGADVLFLPANTWSFQERDGERNPEKSATGHTSYLNARHAYLRTIGAKQTFLVHMSGHEDGPGNPGYGWTDAEWEAAVRPDNVRVARQGMILEL